MNKWSQRTIEIQQLKTIAEAARYPVVLAPSGIHPGATLSAPLLEALERHGGKPLYLQPVIEEGSYADFKACVFRVCSARVCEVALLDLERECCDRGINVNLQYRTWNYDCSGDHRCWTRVEMRMRLKADLAVDEAKAFLSDLASKHGFVYNRIDIRKACSNMDQYGLLSHVEIEAEILWPYWT